MFLKHIQLKKVMKSLIKIDGDLTKLKTHNIFNKHIIKKIIC